MTAAGLALCYALAVAVGAPRLLARLTARGASPRLGLAAWLTAMASAVAGAGAAVWFLTGAAIAGWPGLAQAVCRSVAGQHCGPTVYRSAAFELALAAAAVAAVAAAVTAAWRYGRNVQRAQQRTRAHGEAARITGRALDGDTLNGGAACGAIVVDAAAPAAYCVPRPATIVLTTAALEILEPGQLGAVLAHERAHLAGRHHLLTGLSRGLAAVFPAVPLFSRGTREVARLAEMAADDAAARRTGRVVLVAALLAMARPSRRRLLAPPAARWPPGYSACWTRRPAPPARQRCWP
jgi:Zn-dependent protease with chaperone function